MKKFESLLNNALRRSFLIALVDLKPLTKKSSLSCLFGDVLNIVDTTRVE